jgi:hypothetical protein
VALLRRLLYVDALIHAVLGIALSVVPGVASRTVMDQPVNPAGTPYLRFLGVTSLALALLMVLVAHRIEDLWWWAWAFVLLMGGGAAVATLHAAVGLPAGAPAWPWWVIGGGWWAIAFGLLRGLARTGLERPPA